MKKVYKKCAKKKLIKLAKIFFEQVEVREFKGYSYEVHLVCEGFRLCKLSNVERFAEKVNPKESVFLASDFMYAFVKQYGLDISKPYVEEGKKIIFDVCV